MNAPAQTLVNDSRSSLVNGNVRAQTIGDTSVASLPFQQFIWGAGIECSFLPHLNVDQFQWTQHNRYWRDDFQAGEE